MLSVNSKASAENVKALTDLKAGDTVTISIAASSSRWAQAKYITSGYKKLIENGKVVSGLGSSGAPRTAIGLKDDGTVIFYTIDGRQSGHSVGASENLLAQRLLELGCTTAICLDGGGSTTLTATLPDSTASERINKPSDVLKVGDEVKAKITDIDFDRKRISLSIKALLGEEEAAADEE